MRLQNLLKRLRQDTAAWSCFADNDDGNVSVVVAVSMIPVLMVAGMAVDYSRAARADFRLQAAADAGALAAAAISNADQADRDTAVNFYFAANYTGNNEGTASVTNITYGANTVTVDVQFTMTKGMTGLLSPGSMTTTARSVAYVEEGGPICMLALDETASQAIYLHGNPEIFAAGCNIQSNSNASDALVT